MILTNNWCSIPLKKQFFQLYHIQNLSTETPEVKWKLPRYLINQQYLQLTVFIYSIPNEIKIHFTYQRILQNRNMIKNCETAVCAIKRRWWVFTINCSTIIEFLNTPNTPHFTNCLPNYKQNVYLNGYRIKV